MSRETTPRSPILLALFLSGFAGLMHEIVWARLLANLIGSTAYAQAVVLAVFMGGLALGAVWFGKRSDGRSGPLGTYVKLEVAIALYCLALPFLVRAAGAGYDALAAAAFNSPSAKLGLRIGLALLTVLLPALLMGGTLPVLARHLILEIEETRARVASLYALNNLGAVAGAGIAGFIALPAFGIQGSLAIASVANLAAAAIVWPASRRAAALTAPPKAAAETPLLAPFTDGQRSAAGIALALSGFAAMGYEVIFTRIIALSFGSSAHSFTVMLMVFITGIGLGSAFLAMRREVANPLAVFAWSQIAVVVALALVTPMVARLPYWIALQRIAFASMPSGYTWFQGGKAALILLVLALPTICIGVGFPLAAQIQARSIAGVGRSIGATYAWNTIGNVTGVVVTALVLLPLAGIQGSYDVLLAVNFTAGALVLASTKTSGSRKLVPAGLAVAALAIYALAGRGWSDSINYACNHLRLRTGPDANAGESQKSSHPTATFQNWKLAFVTRPDLWKEFFFEEEADTTVLACARAGEANLFVNGKGDASIGIYDMMTQLMLGHLPLMLAPDPREVLVIGLGSGVTAGAAMLYGVEHMDVVEISRGVLEAERLFSKYNHAVLKNPRVETWRDDARTFLRTVPRRYDVIISEPSNPWIAGVGNLFTREFFEAGRDRLKPGGVMCIWFHQYEQSNEALALVLRTVGSVFPNVSMFLSYHGDVIALASIEPFSADYERMEARFDQAPIRQDLARIGIFNLAILLTHHAVSPSRFASLAPPGPLNRDLHQRLEYLADRGLFAGADATLITHADGFAPLPGGRTDGLFDGYLEWRRQAGDPLTPEELASSAQWVSVMLGEDHRLFSFVRSRGSLGVARATPTSKASRGGAVAIADMDFPEAFNRGHERYSAGAHEEAIPMFRRALEIEPGHPQATIDLVNTLLMLDRLDEAGAAVAASVAAHPDNLDTKVMAAAIYGRTGRIGDAKKMCIEVLARDAVHVPALIMLGNLTEFENKPAEAVPYYERSLQIDPSRWESAMRLAYILSQNPTTQDYARRVLDRAIGFNPERAELREMRAQLQ